MPYLETGNKLECVYDYVRVRIKKASPQDVVEKILGLRYEFFLEEATNILHYNTMLSLDGIKLLFDQPDLTKGVLIELTGNGCRQFESFLKQQERSWYSLFRTCLKFDANLTRLDLAINDYYRFLSIPKLARKIEAGECVTGFRSFSTEVGGSFDGNKVLEYYVKSGSKWDFTASGSVTPTIEKVVNDSKPIYTKEYK